jgi:hypothetical protein
MPRRNRRIVAGTRFRRRAGEPNVAQATGANRLAGAILPYDARPLSARARQLTPQADERGRNAEIPDSGCVLPGRWCPPARARSRNRRCARLVGASLDRRLRVHDQEDQQRPQGLRSASAEVLAQPWPLFVPLRGLDDAPRLLRPPLAHQRQPKVQVARRGHRYPLGTPVAGREHAAAVASLVGTSPDPAEPQVHLGRRGAPAGPVPGVPGHHVGRPRGAALASSSSPRSGAGPGLRA